MQEKHPKDVHAISLNLDHDEDGAPSKELQGRVLAMLTKLGLRCDNVLCSDPCTATLQELGVFGLPAVLVYDREGALVKLFQGRFTYPEDVAPLVAELVGGSR